ncbi:MAG: preprotein translocase subunit YajC [Phycisphaeraceae bacterium]
MLNSIPTILAQEEGGDGPLVLPGNGNGAEQGQAGEAQPSNGADPSPNQNTGGDTPMGGFMWLVLLGVILIMFIFMSTSQRRERKKHEAMLAALSKGDKIQTAGGIIGTIVDIRDDEVLVKVDENANTRLRFARSAIRSVLEAKAGEKE